MECFLKITVFLVCQVFFHQVIADSNSFRQVFCGYDRGNYTKNSIYETNLKDLLSSMASDTKIDYGFYNLSFGQPPNQVNAIALCRADLPPLQCRDCLSISTAGIHQHCTNSVEAIAYYDHCMLRYSNRSLFGSLEVTPGFSMWSLINATDQDKYAEDTVKLIRRLQTLSASGNSLRKFVTGNVTSGFDTIFALTQCTPDLSQRQCEDCLNQATSAMGIYKGKIGGRTYRPSCNLWYENFRFYEGGYDKDEPTSVPPLPTSQEEKKNNRYRTAIIVVVPILGIVILMLSIFIILIARKPNKTTIESKRAGSTNGSTAKMNTEIYSNILAAPN